MDRVKALEEYVKTLEGLIDETEYLSTDEVVLVDGATIAVGEYGNGSASVAKEGFTPIGVVGMHLENATDGGTLNTYCFLHSFYMSGTTVYWIVRNTASSNAKIKVTATVLYGTTAEASGGGGGTNNYDELTNKPQISGVTLTGNKTFSDLGLVVPTKTSDLTNDSGYISSETDPVFTASAAHGITSSDISDWNNKSDFSGDYDDLSNKPTINDVYWATYNTTTTAEIETAYQANKLVCVMRSSRLYTLRYRTEVSGTITHWFVCNYGTTQYQLRCRNNAWDTNSYTLPTKTSDLTNDSGFITTETDPTVPSWAKASSKPTYTASEVGALPDTTTIPSKTSDLTNDSGFITGYTETDPVYSASAASGITSSDITAWNGKSTVSVNRKTTSGTNIADITIDGTTTKLYAPTGGGGGGTITEVKTTAGAHQTIDVTSGVANFAVPTNTSHLANDSGFITGGYLVAITNAEIDTIVSS